jgi:L,D-transpeptidase-like protein
MKVLTNLLFKVTLSSMILTAPAMISASNKDAGSGVSSEKEAILPYYSSTVIKRFVNFSNLTPRAIYPEVKEVADAPKEAAPATVAKERVANIPKEHLSAAMPKAGVLTNTMKAVRAAMELKMVINEAAILYNYMDLGDSGLDEKAFEYAWRGYHNLVKRGMVRKKNVLSICDFSQSSSCRRMYVIDLAHRKLLYRTYVAHGHNSGSEYADSFSNEPESFKSSLGFYVTSRTYYGRNGLSLRIEGVDTGYNDKASKRNIVLHGSNYVSAKYMQDNGSLGTSQGCPAIPASMSPLIIRKVKNGSCIFIYHPTPKYLEESTVING